MNFDQAIAAHAEWKHKLAAYLRKPDHSLKAADVALDNKCELGKWLAGEGSRFAHLPEYATVKSEHSRFHKVASEVVHRADAGKDVSEEVMLGGKSEFAKISSAVVRSIMALKAKVEVPVGSH